MALIRGNHTYVSHAQTGAAYQTALNALVDAIAALDASLSRVHSALYNGGNGAFVVMQSTGGDEWCFAAGTVVGPAANNLAPNAASGADTLVMAYKPNTGTGFPTGTKDPTSVGFCDDCGSFYFVDISPTTTLLYSGNKYFNFLFDDTPYARLWLEYQDTPGSPGTTTSVTLCSPFGAGTMLRSMQTGDVDGGFFLRFGPGLNVGYTTANMQVYDTSGVDHEALQATSMGTYGRCVVHTHQYNATYNTTQPWVAVEMGIRMLTPLGAGPSGLWKGVIDKAHLLLIEPTQVSDKTKLQSGAYLHMTDGIVWPWNNAWTVT